MKKLFLIACLSLTAQPAFAQLGNSINPLGPFTAPDGTIRMYQCYDSPRCGEINIASAQRDGFLIPEGYSKTQPPPIIVRKGGANVESQVMIGVGAAAIVGIAAWLIFREQPKNLQTSASRVGLSFPLN